MALINKKNKLMAYSYLLRKCVYRNAPKCIVSFVALCLMAAPALADVSAAERAALMALYDATKGAFWEINTNWRFGDPCNQINPWYGVTCNNTAASQESVKISGGKTKAATDSITGLQLTFNNLDGVLPPEIGDLPNLVRLDLTANNLNGALPSEIGDLSNLELLHLIGNGLTGSIQPALGQLSKLQELELWGNELSGPIPPELGLLTELKILRLFDNQLVGPVPIEFWNLTKLERLEIQGNNISNALSPEIKKLVNLKNLKFGGEEGQPADFSEGLPSELFGLEQLERLQIFTTNLTGPIPDGIGQLKNLKRLYIWESSFSAGPIPEFIADLPLLEILTLTDTQLTGEIPDFLGNLDELILIRLYGNSLTGAIPASLGNLSKLKTFWFQGNRLVGEIPASLKNLANLTQLNISWNSLSTSDTELNELLDQASREDWSASQTVPPGNVQVSASDDQTVVSLSWDDVEYKGAGRFRLWYATSSGGPWLDGGTTADKSILSHTVEGLLSGETYYFTVQTETDPHENNQNKVISARSAEVSTTTGGEAEPFLINAGLNDAWFNPDTDGQGFFITVFPDVGVVVLAWFTYDTELPPDNATANLGAAGHRWLLAVGPFLNDEAILDIEIASGGIFDTPSEITRDFDGTITLSFDGCNSGMVEYNIPSIGRQGSVPIRRVAKDNVVLCEILNEELHNSQ